MSLNQFVEEVQVLGKDLVERVKSLIHEGNVNRIIIKDDKGNTFIEIPIAIAAIGAIAAPLLAGLGALSALVAKFNMVIERAAEPAPPTPEPKPEAEPEAEPEPVAQTTDSKPDA